MQRINSLTTVHFYPFPDKSVQYRAELTFFRNASK